MSAIGEDLYIGTAIIISSDCCYLYNFPAYDTNYMEYCMSSKIIWCLVDIFIESYSALLRIQCMV